jgi:hypothetical protein
VFNRVLFLLMQFRLHPQEKFDPPPAPIFTKSHKFLMEFRGKSYKIYRISKAIDQDIHKMAGENQLTPLNKNMSSYANLQRNSCLLDICKEHLYQISWKSCRVFATKTRLRTYYRQKGTDMVSGHVSTGSLLFRHQNL